MEASPSCVLATSASDDPRTIGMPFSGTRASVVRKVTFTPITEFEAADPSVTRMTSG